MSSFAPVVAASLQRRLSELAESERGFPPVLSVENDPSATRIVFRIHPDLLWFRGHFPGNPVLPGIVQLHWAVLVCRAVYGVTGSNEIKRLKFKNLIRPPSDIELAVSVSRSGEARFAFSSGGDQNSEGTIVFPESE